MGGTGGSALYFDGPEYKMYIVAKLTTLVELRAKKGDAVTSETESGRGATTSVRPEVDAVSKAKPSDV